MGLGRLSDGLAVTPPMGWNSWNAFKGNIDEGLIVDTAWFQARLADPCGAEHDSPDFCATCEDPIGNPLTDEGVEYVREWLADLPFRLKSVALAISGNLRGGRSA